MKRKLDLNKIKHKISPITVSLEEALKDVEPFISFEENSKDTTADNIQRYCSVSESLEESLKEMKLARMGVLELETWEEVKNELNDEE